MVDGIVFSASFGMEAPPSTEHSSGVSTEFPSWIGSASCSDVVFFDQYHSLEVEERGRIFSCEDVHSHRDEPWC
mgnify:CR=1 FL=1